MSALPPGNDAADATILDRQCTGPVEASEGAFDLQGVAIARRGGAFVFAATYAGKAADHDVHITFDLGTTQYRIDSELFEDGSGVGQVIDLASGQSTFLELPQTISSGSVSLVVRPELVPRFGSNGVVAQVTMKVDGSLVETCG